MIIDKVLCLCCDLKTLVSIIVKLLNVKSSKQVHFSIKKKNIATIFSQVEKNVATQSSLTFENWKTLLSVCHQIKSELARIFKNCVSALNKICLKVYVRHEILKNKT